MKEPVKRCKNNSGMRLYKHISKLRCRITSAALCAVLLVTNASNAFAAELLMNEITSSMESNTQIAEDKQPATEDLPEETATPSNADPDIEELENDLETATGSNTNDWEDITLATDSNASRDQGESCKHHPEHTGECGYTEENPVCAFVCAVCPVQEQIDELLARWEELNEEILDEEELNLFYEEVRAALKAYQALTSEEQAEITGAETLFAVLDERICRHETETDPCPICPVEKMIDDVLVLLEKAEEMDEEGMIRFLEQTLAAKRAYECLEWEEQAQIDADKIELLLAVVETIDAAMLAEIDPAAADDEKMQIATALIRAEGEADQSLTESGNSFNVDFNKQFTLHIVVTSQLNLPGKKVEITVPDGLAVVEFPIPERGGMAEEVTPESVSDLHSEKNYGGYCPTNGSITYSLRSTAETNSFNIILEPDQTLWNRKNKQKLAGQLKVRVYTGEIDDADNQIPHQTISATPTITGTYVPTAVGETAGDRAIQTGPRISSVGVKKGVPAAAEAPFALRQIWVNPDKDFIDMPQFFKKLEITIALPYYEKDTIKVYAAFDHIAFDQAGQVERDNSLDPETHKDNYDGFTYTLTENQDDHTITLTWENLYMPYGQDYFTPYFKWRAGDNVLTDQLVKWNNDKILSTGAQAPGCYLGGTPDAGNNRAAVKGIVTWEDSITAEDSRPGMWYAWNNQFAGLTFTARAGESMEVTGVSSSIYNAYNSDPSIVYYLGQFHVVNQGGEESAEKTVEFTYRYNDRIGVTAQKIPATSGNSVTVWYQTTKTADDTWTPYSGSTLTSSGGFVLFTAKLAGLGEDEYFTKIKADVGKYERDYVGYVASRANDPTSSYGTTFGKLLRNEISANPVSGFATMKMYDVIDGNAKSDANVKPVTYNITFKSGKEEVPLAMELAYDPGSTVNSIKRVPVLRKKVTDEEGKVEMINTTNAAGGDTINFSALLSSSAYPYSSCNIITDPEIYIRLPEKITVDEDSIQIVQETGRTADKVFLSDAVLETKPALPDANRAEITAYKFEEVTPTVAAAEGEDTETKYKTYKITFSDSMNPVKVGWWTEDLAQYQIALSFDMVIAKDADAMTLNMRDCVRFKSKEFESTSNTGTLKQYQEFDTNDMDGDGEINERFSTFNTNLEGIKLSVVATRLGLDFTFGARVAEKGSEASWEFDDFKNYEEDKSTVYLKDENHVIGIMFTLKNNTGRAFTAADAQAFYYFIPIPEKDDLWDSHMQDEPFEFDMRLTRAPILKGSSAEHIDVTYATEIESNAQPGDAKHYATVEGNYKTEEELLAGCITDMDKLKRWEKVKMVRIAAKPEITSIPEDAELKLNLRLEPWFDKDIDADNVDMTNAALVGSVINFGPCGVSPYSVGNTTNQGHNPLSRIQIEYQTGVIAGNIFLDENCNGAYDSGEKLYMPTDLENAVHVKAKHLNGVVDNEEVQEMDTKSGTFEFDRRRPDTYDVVVTNPGDPVEANADNALRFSLPESVENDSVSFSEDGSGKTATATVILDVNNENETIKAAQNLLIGFQKPHKVIFTADKAELSKSSTKVWHTDKLTDDDIPTVTPTDKYRFTGWKIGNQEYTAKALKELEIKADTEITAVVKPTYAVTYDGNGNTSGTVPTDDKRYITGELVTPKYAGPESLKRDNDIFVGWSIKKITNPLKATEKDTADAEIIGDTYVMPGYDVVLYAVYAVDANSNGKPDYADEAVHVRYHGNNNDRTDIICPHYHVVGEEVVLSINGTVSGKKIGHDDPASVEGVMTTHTFTYGNDVSGNANIFLGWSTAPILNEVIDTKAEYDDLNRQYGIVNDQSDKKTVTMLGMPGDTVSENDKKDTSKYADADGNTNVYAVWAADRNGNGTADYLEERVLAYDGNAQSGTVTNVPYKVTTKEDGRTPLLSGDKVTLTGTPTHSEVGGKRVVFIGWTANATTGIFNRKATTPKTIKEVTIGSGENKTTTVYAAWGYDENGNGTADVLETYSLTYDLNGGSGTAPEEQTDIPKGTEVVLTTEKNFTRGDGEVFVGWSRTKNENAFTKDQKKDANVVLIHDTTIKMGAANVTLYAVWAVDLNNNKIPDYAEYKLTYKPNPQFNGTVDNMPEDTTCSSGKFELSGTTPTHSEAGGKKVVFIGWTKEAADKIYSGADTAPSCITEVTFENDDITVYAAWGYDEDDNKIADVLETYYTVTYDLDGGSGNYGQDVVKSGALYQVKAAPSREGVEFLYWKDGAGTEYQPGKQITVTGNLILTAQWKKKDSASEGNTGSLTVSVTVEGNAGEKDKEFHFTVTLSDKAISGTYGNMEFTDGVANLVLKHGESKTAAGLPAGVPYEVTETEANQDGYTTVSNGHSGTIEANKTADAVFVNTKNAVPVAPDRPTRPGRPNDSDRPVNSMKPNDLDKPAVLEKLNAPDGPISLEKPIVPDRLTDNLPKTGDETNLALWLILLGISGIGMIAALPGTKRKHRGKRSK